MPSLSRRAFVGAVTASAIGRRSEAQGASFDTVQIVTGATPGEPASQLCRLVGNALHGTDYAATVQVDSRSMESRSIIASLKGAPSDGSVLLGTWGSTLDFDPLVDPKLTYDPFEDVQPIIMACTSDFTLAVGPAIPISVRTLKDYIAWCEGDPKQANFTSSAPGSLGHLMGVMLGKSAGINLWHVASRGLQPAIDDLIAGKIQVVCGPLGPLLQHAYAGRVSLLGVSGPKRSRFAMGIPTFAEQGLTEAVFSEWFGFFTPGDTSSRVALSANEALRKALATKEVTDGLLGLGLDAKISTPAELAQRLKSDHERFGALVRKMHFTAAT